MGGHCSFELHKHAKDFRFLHVHVNRARVGDQAGWRGPGEGTHPSYFRSAVLKCHIPGIDIKQTRTHEHTHTHTHTHTHRNRNSGEGVACCLGPRQKRHSQPAGAERTTACAAEAVLCRPPNLPQAPLTLHPTHYA